MKKTATQIMDEVDNLIEEGLDIKGLKRVRRRLYRLDTDGLSTEEKIRKDILLTCISEFLE